jgi:hypothetical protein
MPRGPRVSRSLTGLAAEIGDELRSILQADHASYRAHFQVLLPEQAAGVQVTCALDPGDAAV